MPRLAASTGEFVHTHRKAILVAWLVVAVGLIAANYAAGPTDHAEPQLLPDDSPSRRAVLALCSHFPGSSGLGEAAIVFERADRLTREDMDAIEQVAHLIEEPSALASSSDLAGVNVRSPASIQPPTNPLTGEPMWRNLLVSNPSEAGQAAMIQVSIPADYISLHSDRIVRHIRSILAAQPLPDGLTVAVSGSAGFGHDYAAAAVVSHRRTVKVTLVAVVLILLAIYRSPLAPLVPIAAISLAAVVAFAVLRIANRVGLHTGTAEEIFVFVLIYGAGVDYTLLLMSRYRELLATGCQPDAAAREGLTRSLPAILAAACTVTAGLLMMSFARYGVFRSAGPAVAIALVVALLASVTLAPAMVGIAGARLFWPRRPGPDGPAPRFSRRAIWAVLARAVTGKPVLTLAATLAVLALPALRGAKVKWVYDTLASIVAHEGRRVGGAARGLEIAKRHWPVGEIGPVTVLVESPEPVAPEEWVKVASHLSRVVMPLRGVVGVRSMSAPLGTDEPAAANFLAGTVGWGRVVQEYVSADGRAARMTVLMDKPALSLEAMASVRRIQVTAETAAARLLPGSSVLTAGASAEMADIRDVTRSDFKIIVGMALAAIFIIVLVLLRDAILAAFMVASTLVSYFAALGISYWVFVALLGEAGLDWKVEVFLFVVMVAVGQDYNIFLTARLSQEAILLPPRRATRRALVHTGPVISSCGLIMAATLGSLMSGRLLLLRQLGFALALGMLIDTFVVRPLLLPAFVAVTGRTGRTRFGWH